MQPLRKEDVFTGVDTGVFEPDAWMPSPESSFETFRGLLLAGVVGLPLWAAIILACYWIWF